jgi:hypothetical protein
MKSRICDFASSFSFLRVVEKEKKEVSWSIDRFKVIRA